MRSRFSDQTHSRVTLSAAAMLAFVLAVGLIAPSTAQARFDSPHLATSAGVLQPTRAISIPFGISSATLFDQAIVVVGHDGTPPIIVDSVRQGVRPFAVEPGCPPEGHTVELKVHVRDRAISGAMAKGDGEMSCSESTWSVAAEMQASGQFVAGNDVWVCAQALVRTDPAAKPGKKGHVVGYRQWCKTVELE